MVERSRSAAGEGYRVARRYWMERQRPPICLARRAVVERDAAGLPRLGTGF